MGRPKKIEYAKQLIAGYAHLLACPLCGGAMGVCDPASLVCGGGHSFNIARQGYVNLLQKNIASRYDRQMLESRSTVAKSGFFDPLLRRIAEIAQTRLAGEKPGGLSILDAGCGEGSTLARIARLVGDHDPGEIQGVGVDISRAGIKIAAREHPGFVWCVADLAALPLRDDQFDLVLNILAPANYGEFRRVLHARGILLKVVPGPGHLAEMRRAFHPGGGGQESSGAGTMKHLRKRTDPSRIDTISYRVEVERGLLEPLVRMSPLSWNADPERVDAFLNGGSRAISVDLRIVATDPQPAP